MISASASEGTLQLLRTWMATPQDVIPIVGGRNVLIKHPDHIRAVLTDNSFTKETGANRRFRDHVADGVLTAPADRHRAERLLLNAATRDFMTLNCVATEHVEALASLMSWHAARGERVDLTAAMNRLALGVIAEVLFGWTAIDELAEAMAAAMAVLDASGAMLPTQQQLSPVRDRVFRAVHELVELQPPSERGPALTAMIDAAYSRDAIAHQAVTLLLAGHETTANSLAWIWISLIRTPDAYGRWQQQMLAVPRMARAATGNVTREGLRLFPSSWIIGRKSTTDTEIDGTPIPRGCTITISPYVTHRHPQFWPDPERFDPSRHDGSPVHRFAWLPFGAGARMCLGSTYALWEADITLSTLGQRFRFHSDAAETATPRFRYTLGAPPMPVDIQPLGQR
ncbi:cytochrome P450 [Nocardia pseudovaccinii]|uniref:cytochrome P450 n=1 Tax=Nocardia pseudovaccinii TaxID=189540 RepID=UPI000A4DF5B6|nr:cytochrome P450 [Nocardia pseudovaccinii]